MSRKKRAAFLIAAGIGSRMSLNIPNCLVKIPSLGMSSLKYLVSILIANLSIDKIYVVIGYESQLVKEELSGYADRISFIYNNYYDEYGKEYSMSYLAQVPSSFEEVLIMDSNILIPEDYFQDLLNSDLDIALLGKSIDLNRDNYKLCTNHNREFPNLSIGWSVGENSEEISVVGDWMNTLIIRNGAFEFLKYSYDSYRADPKPDNGDTTINNVLSALPAQLVVPNDKGIRYCPIRTQEDLELAKL